MAATGSKGLIQACGRRGPCGKCDGRKKSPTRRNEAGARQISHIVFGALLVTAAASYLLINYLMNPQVVANISNAIGFENASLAATPLLDVSIASNMVVYPTRDQQQRLFVQMEAAIHFPPNNSPISRAIKVLTGTVHLSSPTTRGASPDPPSTAAISSTKSR
jgi:hypothetical protein